MLVMAASMYLPNHAMLMYRRIWYYVHGEIASITKSGGVVGEVVKTSLNGGAGPSVGVGETELLTAMSTSMSRVVGEL